MPPDRLVRMVNQICRAFAHQGEDAAAAATAEHLRLFWDPRMRASLLDHYDKGGDGLDPGARKAVQELNKI